MTVVLDEVFSIKDGQHIIMYIRLFVMFEKHRLYNNEMRLVFVNGRFLYNSVEKSWGPRKSPL